MRDNERVDRILRQGVPIASLGDGYALCRRRREVQHAGINQPVMHHDIGGAERLHGTHRQQPGIARPRTDEDDAPAGGRVEKARHGTAMRPAALDRQTGLACPEQRSACRVVIKVKHVCHGNVMSRSGAMKKLLAMVGTVLVATAAQASDLQGFAGAKEIARGDYVAAERLILEQQRMFPRDADLLINLAYVYARTGRQAEARRLYEQVVAQPNELLDLSKQRTAKAHRIAAAGLKRLDQQVAAR
jgi:tetratricopeptide (TPR) repeat protein